jgi:nitrate reductase NapE component
MNALLLYYLVFFSTFLLFSIEYHSQVKITAGRKKSNLRNVIKSFIFLSIALVPVFIILVNRYMVGTDYGNYMRMYNDCIKYDYINYEYGIVTLFKISDAIGWEFKGFLFLAALLGINLSTVAIKRQCSPRYFPVAVLIYLFIYFGPACNIMAQVIAVSFAILAYEQMIKKNLKLYVIFCLLGSLFHLAILIIIPVYWAYNLEGKTRTRFVSTSIIVLMGLFTLYPSIISGILNGIGLAKYSHYLQYLQYDKIKTFSFLLLYRSPLIILELLYRRKIVAQSKHNQLYYFLVVLEIASCILGIGIPWAGRLAYFFSVTHVFLVAKILEVTKNGNERLIVGIIIVAYFVIAFYMIHFFSEFDDIMVYQFA